MQREGEERDVDDRASSSSVVTISEGSSVNIERTCEVQPFRGKWTLFETEILTSHVKQQIHKYGRKGLYFNIEFSDSLNCIESSLAKVLSGA